MKSKRKPAKITGKHYNSVEELISDMKNTSPETFKILKEQRKMAESYPRLTELDIPIYKEKQFCYVKPKEVSAALKKHNLDEKEFHRLFGVQTVAEVSPGEIGLYLDDTESVIERMISGRKTKSQLFWD